MYDNASAHDGAVVDYKILVSPRPKDENNFTVTIRPGGWYYDYIDVPTDATNLNISVSFMEGSGPVDIVLRQGDWPPPADGQTNGIMAPGGSLNYCLTNTPPLAGGLWYYGLHNRSTAKVVLHVVIKIDQQNGAGRHKNLLQHQHMGAVAG